MRTHINQSVYNQFRLNEIYNLRDFFNSQSNYYLKKSQKPLTVSAVPIG